MQLLHGVNMWSSRTESQTHDSQSSSKFPAWNSSCGGCFWWRSRPGTRREAKAHVSFKETRHKGCDIPVRLPGSFKAVKFIYNPAAFKDAVTIHGNRAFTHTRAHTVTHVWFLTLVNTQLCSSCHMSLWCGYVCVSVCVVCFFYDWSASLTSENCQVTQVKRVCKCSVYTQRRAS